MRPSGDLRLRAKAMLDRNSCVFVIEDDQSFVNRSAPVTVLGSESAAVFVDSRLCRGPTRPIAHLSGPRCQVTRAEPWIFSVISPRRASQVRIVFIAGFGDIP